MTLQNLKFDESGLIPTIVQDNLKGCVLRFCRMNAEALALTLQTGVAHFWNSTEQRVLRQTDAAGNTQEVVDIIANCDGDALIIKVDTSASPSAVVEESRFGTSLLDQDASSQEVSIVNLRSMEIGLMLSELFQLIVERERERPENSYTARLFESGLDAMLKKLGQQVMETTLAAKNNDRQQVSSHIADLLYHLLVLMVGRELDLRDILNALRQRAGLPDQPLPQELHSS